MPENKPWWKSKTVWLNGVMLASGTCAYLVDADMIQQHPKLVAILIAIQSIANVFLRFNSITPVTIKKK